MLQQAGGERGFMMVALLVTLAIMAITLTAFLPAWSTMQRREREAELVFRGEQYARAIMLFQKKYAGASPPTIDALVSERFLRKKYKDPITNDDFQTITVGTAVTLPGQTGGGATAGRGGSVTAPGGITLGTPAGGRTGQPAATGRGTTTTTTATGGRTSGSGIGGITPGGGATAGIMGVTSKSDAASLRLYKNGDHYNQWLFIPTQQQTQAGGRGQQTPGQGVRGGQAGPQRGGVPGRGGAGPGGSSPFGQPPPPPPPASRGRLF